MDIRASATRALLESSVMKVNGLICDVCYYYIIDIDDCTSNPCVHGLCTDGINNYYCSCEIGYTGVTCAEGGQTG